MARSELKRIVAETVQAHNNVRLYRANQIRNARQVYAQNRDKLTMSKRQFVTTCCDAHEHHRGQSMLLQKLNRESAKELFRYYKKVVSNRNAQFRFDAPEFCGDQDAFWEYTQQCKELLAAYRYLAQNL